MGIKRIFIALIYIALILVFSFFIIKGMKGCTNDSDIKMKGNIDATYLIHSYARKTNSPDFVYKKDGDVRYLFHEIHLNEKGKDGPALGYVMIYPDGRVVSGVYKHEIQTRTEIVYEKEEVVTKNKAYLVMKQSGLANRKGSDRVNWKNVPYELELISVEESFNVEVVKRRKIVFDFCPEIGVNGIMVFKDQEFDVIPSLGFSVISYKDGEKIKYRFLKFAVGVRDLSAGANISFSPVLYNLGNKISYINNTYLAPVLGYDKRGFDFGLSLSLTF